MFNSPWIRKPNFNNVAAIGSIDYNEYWRYVGWNLNEKLKPREELMLEIISPNSKVIDIGCGSSRLPVHLKEKNCDISVADISDIVIEQYEKLGIDGIKIDLEDVGTYKFSNTFDYIILSEVLEHTKNPEQIIDILKPYTKHFLITIPNSANYLFRYGLMFKGRFFTQWIYHPSEHLRYWSHIDFIDWLKSLGIEIISTTVSDGFTFGGLMPWLPGLWKNLLGYRMVYYCRVK